MKAIYLTICFICISVCVTHAGKKIDPNPSFQKLVTGATRVVIRHGGASLRASKKGEVYFEINDFKKIKELTKNIQFVRGVWDNEACDCNGSPGMDWYVADKLVAVTAIKHGDGIVRNGSVANFTALSKAWIMKWFIDHGMKKEQLK